MVRLLNSSHVKFPAHLILSFAYVGRLSKAYFLGSNQSDPHFQAFAWFSDLLVEHSEIFWSLFGVDMDTVLAEQPPDT